MKKVLVTVPDLRLTGGVANYYKYLKLNEVDDIEYFNVNGGRFRNVLFRLIERNIVFFFLIRKFDVIHINPSLLKKSYLRDSLFMLSGLLRKKKIIVFIRGWDNHFEKQISENNFYRFIFKHVWCKVDEYIVLGKLFLEKLTRLGINKNIQIETTLSVYQSQKIKKISKNDKIELLFISRIVKEKGVFIAIDTLKILQNKFGLNQIHLNIAGSGKILPEVESYIKLNKINNCHLLGNVSGKDKDILFDNSHIMLFPTYFGEGLPNSILEGMGSGMPIISRINAGIPDQVIQGVNGYLTKSKNPEWFAKTIFELINNNEFAKISQNNIQKAKYYSAEAIKNRLIKIYNEV